MPFIPWAVGWRDGDNDQHITYDGENSLCGEKLPQVIRSYGRPSAPWCDLCKWVNEPNN